MKRSKIPFIIAVILIVAAAVLFFALGSLSKENGDGNESTGDTERTESITSDDADSSDTEKTESEDGSQTEENGSDDGKLKVYIDQGHNPSGFDIGASANGLDEFFVNYDIGISTANLLLSSFYFDTELTRLSTSAVMGSDELSSLEERAKKANEWGADIFISIHCGVSDDPEKKGTAVYIANEESRALGEAICDSIVSSTGLADGGVATDTDSPLLKSCNMPAVIVNTAFITNSDDAELLSSDPTSIAYAIRDAVLEYYGIDGDSFVW